MEIITSKSNEKVKYLKNLNEKKFRLEYNAFYLEGIKVIDEILENKKAVNVKFIAFSNEILSTKNGGDKLIEKLKKEKDIQIIQVDKKVFEYITDTVSPQGVLAVIEIPKYDLENVISNCSSNILLLDKVQDSGNLGTIIRNAVAFGIENIICIKGTTDVYSNKVTRSTMGTILKERIIYVEDIEKLTKLLKENGYKMVGTSLNTNYYLEDLEFNTAKYCFVLGNEANGVSDEILSKCDNLVKIKMEENVESLNVSSASAILLYKQYIDKK